MKEYITDAHNGLTYEKVGDFYLPCFTVPERAPLGIWGQRHRDYLREYKEGIYTGLWLSGELDTYLAELNQQAEDMFFQLVNALAEKEGVTEQMKATDQLAWVASMNGIHARATEIVNKELIFI